MASAEMQLSEFNTVVLDAMTSFSAKLTMDFYRDAVELIGERSREGSRLHITGIGKPHHVGMYMASLFSSTGTPCYFLDGTEATHGSSGQVVPGDVVICVSYYGNVPELMKTVATLKANGARLIACTGFDDSWIAREAEVHLNCFVEREGDSLGKPPRTSMLATLYTLMGLSLVLQESKGMDHVEYVRYHPSGQLGKL